MLAGRPCGLLTGVDRSLTGALPKGTLLHATSVPTMARLHPSLRHLTMTLLLLEALGAGLIFIGIIWWTMFSGRKGGELPTEADRSENKDK